MEYQVYTVSGLTADVKYLIESNFPPVWVEGEISNFTHHRSGHMYFSLKDESSSLRCVFFKQNNFRIQFEPESGMKVLAFGELSVYEPSGQYQLKVVRLKPFGVGELQLAFEQLKQRLEAEGLFDPEHKRQLPAFPNTVGVVTSDTGAAVRDIISVISRRCPPTRIVLYPVRVQGEGAAREIAGAIEAFGRWGEADVLIVGRGGGSMEDLWAFNEEVVARAIYNSPVPVVSAVGHETDYTIADFVADSRAPTPSAAAEFVVPEARELAAGVSALAGRMARVVGDELERAWQRVDSCERGLSPRRMAARLSDQQRWLASQVRMMATCTNANLAANTSRWNGLRRELSALNPAAVLGRGYAVPRTADGALIRNAGQLSKGDPLELLLAGGSLDCRVEKVNLETSSLAGAKKLPPRFNYNRHIRHPR